MEKYYTVERSQQIVLQLLKSHGIKRIIASPGTTNLTLVASAQQDPFFQMYSSVDERSAAYMACGMAAQTGEPVVLSCTGATASRNYLPGLTEAYYRKLPVLAITANQGRDKVGQLIAQNIDRSTVPNDVALLSVSVPACLREEDVAHCELKINEALLELRHRGGGPVHIDLSTTYSRDYSARELPESRVIQRYAMGDALPALPDGRIAVFVGSHATMSDSEVCAIEAFCETHGAVVLCDKTSGYYGKYKVNPALLLGQLHYHTDLSCIETLIHIGEVSGDYYGLCINPNQVWRVNRDGMLRDTFGKLTAVFEMPEDVFFSHYAGSVSCTSNELLARFSAEYDKIYAALPELPFSNIWIARKLAPQLPENSVLHLGILNTLRSWNFFPTHESIQTYCNVGGFGIDGILSTVIGSALACPEKIFYCVIGDLAFFYDLNALGNRHVPGNLRILLINNGRGTEFSNYSHPGYEFGEKAEPYIAAARHFGNQSPLLIRHYAEDLGFTYLTASDKESFEEACKHFLHPADEGTSIVFEVFTDSHAESEAVRLVLNCLNNEVEPEKPSMLRRVARKVKHILHH